MAADLALARRAVACPGFRWVPGMLAVYPHTTARVLDGDPGESWLAYRHDERRLANGGLDMLGALPDLTDPATLGCLLALVREAWRPTCPTPFTLDCSPELGDDSPWTLLICGDRSRTWAGPLAECLVAALEAAPEAP